MDKSEFPPDRCQCSEQGIKVLPDSEYWPDEVNIVDHEPNMCQGTRWLKPWRRNGKVINLCSTCSLTSDIPLDGDRGTMPPTSRMYL